METKTIMSAKVGKDLGILDIEHGWAYMDDDCLLTFNTLKEAKEYLGVKVKRIAPGHYEVA